MKDFYGLKINKWEKCSEHIYNLEMNIPQNQMRLILVTMTKHKDIKKLISFKEERENILIIFTEHVSGIVDITISAPGRNVEDLLEDLQESIIGCAAKSGYYVVNWNGIMQIISKGLRDYIDTLTDTPSDNMHDNSLENVLKRGSIHLR